MDDKDLDYLQEELPQEPSSTIIDVPEALPITVLVEDGDMTICVPEDCDRASVSIDGQFFKEFFSGTSFRRMVFTLNPGDHFVEVVASYPDSSHQDVFRDTVHA